MTISIYNFENKKELLLSLGGFDKLFAATPFRVTIQSNISQLVLHLKLLYLTFFAVAITFVQNHIFFDFIFFSIKLVQGEQKIDGLIELWVNTFFYIIP